MNNQELYCDQCGELINDEVCYIGRVKAAFALGNPIFCSQDCLLDYLAVNGMPVEEWNE